MIIGRKRTWRIQLQLGTTKPYLGVEVATYSLLSPWLEIELGSSLFFGVSHHVGHGLRETGRWWEVQLVISAISSLSRVCPKTNLNPSPNNKTEIPPMELWSLKLWLIGGGPLKSPLTAQIISEQSNTTWYLAFLKAQTQRSVYRVAAISILHIPWETQVLNVPKIITIDLLPVWCN